MNHREEEEEILQGPAPQSGPLHGAELLRKDSPFQLQVSRPSQRPPELCGKGKERELTFESSTCSSPMAVPVSHRPLCSGPSLSPWTHRGASKEKVGSTFFCTTKWGELSHGWGRNTGDVEKGNLAAPALGKTLGVSDALKGNQANRMCLTLREFSQDRNTQVARWLYTLIPALGSGTESEPGPLLCPPPPPVHSQGPRC